MEQLERVGRAARRARAACHPENLERWLATLAAEGKKPSTLSAYLTAVSQRHANEPGPNPAQDPGVRQVLAGLRRLAVDDGYAPKQSDPLRWHHIKLIIHAAPAPRPNQPGGRLETAQQAAQRAVTDIALICVAHDAALRSSELLALNWSDVELPQDGLGALILIRRSKTDQDGRGTALTISQFTAQALARHKPPDAEPDDKVFKMSPSALTRRIKAAAQAAGIDPRNITTHSPRIGMAQDLTAAGTDLPGLMQACRWDTSKMAAHYTKRINPHHTAAAEYLRSQHHPTR